MDVNDSLDVGTKGAWKKMSKKASMEKREDEAIDGDGVVTMNTHKKKLMEHFACKWNMAIRPGKACIPLVTHW